MTAYVSCHGSLDSSRPETFVPYYISAVKYYSKADDNLYQSNEMGILAQADLGLGEPNDNYGPGDPIPNYSLSPNSSEDAALSTYFEPSGGKLYLRDGRTAMCMNDGTDDEGQPQACDKDQQVHYCSGLLGKKAWADKSLQGDIVMLACRGIRGRANKSTPGIGADDDTFVNDAVKDLVAQWTAADASGKQALYDRYTPATRALMMSHSYAYCEWDAARQARGLIASDGDQAMLAYYLSGEQANYRKALDADPDIAASLGRARQQVADFKAAAHDARSTLWAGLSAADRQYLAARDPEIQQWADSYGDRAELLGGPGTVSTDEFAVTAARVGEQFKAISQAIDGLTGSDADANALAGIGEAYGAMMTDGYSLEALSAGNQDRLRAAVGLYSAGATLGTELQAYGEHPEEDTLVTLKTATGDVGAWVNSLG